MTFYDDARLLYNYRAVIGEDAVLEPMSGDFADVLNNSIPPEIRNRMKELQKLGIIRLQGRATILHLILFAHFKNYGFTWLTLGEKGSGKTTLTSWLLFLVTSLFKDPSKYPSLKEYVDAVWDEALNYIVYSIHDFYRIKAEAKERRLPLLIIDDASLHLNSRRSWDPEQREFIRTFGTIREYANTVILADTDMMRVDSAIRREANGLILCFSELDLINNPVFDIVPALKKIVLNNGRFAFFYYRKTSPNPWNIANPRVFLIPIHGISTPIIISEPIPSHIKAKLDANKVANTEIVDRQTQENSIYNPRIFKEVRQTLNPYHDKILEAVVDMVGEMDSSNPWRVKFSSNDLENFIRRKGILEGWKSPLLKQALNRLATAKKPLLLTYGDDKFSLSRFSTEYLAKLKEEEQAASAEIELVGPSISGRRKT